MCSIVCCRLNAPLRIRCRTCIYVTSTYFYCMRSLLSGDIIRLVRWTGFYSVHAPIITAQCDSLIRVFIVSATRQHIGSNRCGKNNPLKLVAIFSATAWNFSEKFYTYMWGSYPHLIPKRHLIIFKHNKVSDDLAWPHSDADFRSLKNICTEAAKQRHWNNTVYDVWQSHCVLEMSTASFCAYLESLVNRFLWQAVSGYLQRFFEFSDRFEFWMELVIGLRHRTPDMVVYGSGEPGGHWSFLMHSVKPFLCDACLSLIACPCWYSRQDTTKF